MNASLTYLQYTPAMGPADTNKLIRSLSIVSIPEGGYYTSSFHVFSVTLLTIEYLMLLHK